MRGNGIVLSRDRADKIDALFAKWTEKGEPGGALALARNGELIHQRCYGLANVEHGVPIQPDTRFHIASVTKTFVGAAIVLLHRQGKLSLDADVRDHVPELTVSEPLSLRRLLTMTSGLRDSMESMMLRGVWFRYPRSEKDLFDLLFNQRSMSWPTGQRYVYTNINFNLLSLVIERVSGRRFAEFLAANFWQPLGMAATQLRDSNTILVSDLADAYIPNEGKLTKGTWAFGIAGAGGLVSNLPDLLRWQGMFRAGGVGDVKLLDMMAERGRLNDGRLVHYGLGLGVRGHRGVTVLCHGGSLPGYKAMFARVPERDFGLVLLSNREDAEPYTRLYQIIDIALDGELPEPGPTDLARSRLPAMTIPKETWGALDGRYLDAESGEPLDVKFNRDTATIEADKLGFALALRPAGADVFLDSWLNFDATLRIEPVADGRPRLHLDFGGQVGTFDWAPAYRPAAADLASTVGVYRSDDLRSSCEVKLKDGQLVIRFGPDFHEGAECPLEPLARDMFFGKRDEPGVKKRYAVRFRRAGAAIAGILISSDRLKDARFARVTAGYGGPQA